MDNNYAYLYNVYAKNALLLYILKIREGIKKFVKKYFRFDLLNI
jgi:hypothetical protein